MPQHVRCSCRSTCDSVCEAAERGAVGRLGTRLAAHNTPRCADARSIIPTLSAIAAAVRLIHRSRQDSTLSHTARLVGHRWSALCAL